MKKIYTLLAALAFATGLTAQPPTSGLIAKYNFNGGVITDGSGNNHNLTNVGTTPTATDPGGSGGMALHFGGANYLYADNMGTMPGSFTVSMWVKPDKTAMLAQTGMNPLMFGLGGDIAFGYSEQVDVVNNMGLWSPGTNQGAGYQTSARVDDNHWIHLTMVYDFNQGVGATMKLYVNGSNLIYSNTYYMAHGLRTPTNKLTIGAGLSPNGTVDANSYFTGDIDEVYFYDRALQNFEINAIYYATTPVASTPYFIITPANADNHACEGGTYTAPSFANGHYVNSVSWLHNGNPTGQTSNELYLSPLTLDMTGSYYCQATNTAGTNYSEQFSLTVDPLPTEIIGLPDTTWVCATNDTMNIPLAYSVTGGTSYSWFKNTDENPFIVGAGVTNINALVVDGDMIYVGSAANCGGLSDQTLIKFVTVEAPAVAFNNNTLIATGGTYTSIQWYVNGTGILNASGATFTPTQIGNYYAVVTTGNCDAITDTIEVLTIGITENELGTINLYPNPASNKLSVSVGTFKPNTTVAIYNTQGILLSQTTLSALNTELNIEGLATGYYFVKINTANGSIIKPFVKM